MTAPAPVESRMSAAEHRRGGSPSASTSASVATAAAAAATPLGAFGTGAIGDSGPRTPEPAAPAVRPRRRVEIRTRPSLDFSLTGLIYCAMLLFMGLAAINTQANLLFGVFGLMIGVLLISFMISRWVLRAVTIRRVVPDFAVVGAPTRITYEIDNRKRWWPTFSVTIAELDAPGAFDRQPHSYVMHAAAGLSATVAAEVVPMRRGVQRLERYQVSTSFPFGFIRRAMLRRQADTILVHPAQGAVEPAAMNRFLSAESTGTSQRPREGGADEFYGAREYRAGDSLRMVHWKRSARSMAARTPSNPEGTLIVKQMTRVSPPRLMLLVDAYAPALAAGRPAEKEAELAARAAHQQRLGDVERNLATAASLLTAAARYGLRVGVIAGQDGGAGVRWLEIMPERGKRHARDTLSALAELGRNTQADAAALVARATKLGTTGDTTFVLISSGRRDSENGGTVDLSSAIGRGAVRGRLMSIRTATAELSRWVRFDEELDFAAMAHEG